MSQVPADRRVERPALSLAPNEPRGPVDVAAFGERLRTAIREPMQIADEALEVVLARCWPGAPAARGPAGRRQDAARPHARRRRRGRFARVQATVDLLPDRHPGRDDLARGHRDLRVPSRPRLRQRRARRRAQSRHAEDPVRPAGGDAGAAGHRRRPHPPAGAAVHGHRDPEPDVGYDGTYPLPARAARPLPRPRLARLSEPTRRRSRCCVSRQRGGVSAPARCASCSRAQAQVGGGAGERARCSPTSSPC